MRLHDKVEQLCGLRPDLAVIPECACPEVLLRRCLELGPSDFAWEGVHPSKGLAVLAFGRWRLEVDPLHRPRTSSTLPLRVSGPASLRLLAVWALPRWAHPRRQPPPEPLAHGLTRLRPFLSRTPLIVAGDFQRTLLRRTANGNPEPSQLARRLAGLGLVSAYHRHRGVAPGHEPEPTYCRYRRIPGRHHTDLVLVDGRTASGIHGVEIGRAREWTKSSDHLPVIVDVEVPSRRGERSRTMRSCRNRNLPGLATLASSKRAGSSCAKVRSTRRCDGSSGGSTKRDSTTP
jgi:exodeoxyribonuclease-3